MRLGFMGLDNTARAIERVYVGVDGVAQRCVRGYVGVNGRAKICYPPDVEIPTAFGSFVFDRERHSATIRGVDPETVKVSGTTEARDVGSYAIYFSLKSKYLRWKDGTTAVKKMVWEITRKPVAVPTLVKQKYKFNKTLQTATISSYDPNEVKVSGEVSATNAGTHTVIFNLTELKNYYWEGTQYDTNPKFDTWTMDPMEVSLPTVSGAYTYNGKVQYAAISGYDADAIKAGGITYATNAGNYTVKFSLRNPSGYINYIWTDGSTGDKSAQWSISRISLAVPGLKGDTVFTYDGNAKSVKATDYDTKLISFTGNSGTNAGKYTAYFALIDKVNYRWSDGSITDKPASWEIKKVALSKPVPKTYSYDGKFKAVEFTGYDSKLMTYGNTKGDVKEAAVAGTYHVTFVLTEDAKKNTTWWDGTTTPKQVDWTIAKAKISKPIFSTSSYSYDGAEHSLVYTGASGAVVDGTVKTKTAGSYTVKFRLPDKSNYVWADSSGKESSDDISVTWTIARKKVAVPTAKNSTFTFNGKEQGPAITYDANYVNVANNSKKDAGSYTLTFTLKDTTNYQWNRSSDITKEITFNWNINKLTLNVPTVTGSFTYDGNNKSASISSYDATYVKQSGNAGPAKDAGSYAISFDLVDKNNTQWNDAGNRTGQHSFSWSIEKKSVSEPTVSSDLTYNGNKQSPSISGFDSGTMKKSGDSETNAGNYNVTFELLDTKNYKWAGGLNGQINRSWSIKKAVPWCKHEVSWIEYGVTFNLVITCCVSQFSWKVTGWYSRPGQATYEQIDLSGESTEGKAVIYMSDADDFSFVVQTKETNNYLAYTFYG